MGSLKFLLVLAVLLILRHIVLRILRKCLPPISLQPPPDAEPIFQKNFSFGISSSAYQTESGVPDSNWSRWETEHGYTGDTLRCDSLGRFEGDAGLLQEMGCSAYRIGVSWSRLNPRRYEFDRAELETYRNMCVYLQTVGIEPIVTLWHYEIPDWLESIGGVLAPEFVSSFVAFTEFVLSGLQDSCRKFETVCNPTGFCLRAYLLGTYPPGKRSPGKFIEALSSLLRAHVAAYNVIKRRSTANLVTVSHEVLPLVPKHPWSLVETCAACLGNSLWTLSLRALQTESVGPTFFRRHIAGLYMTCDAISLVHYYTGFVTMNWREWAAIGEWRLPISFGSSILPDDRRGRGIVPGSLGGVVRWIWRNFGSMDEEIWVLEHGVWDQDDEMRVWFLRESLQHLEGAVRDGVRVGCYLHFTLVDCWDWERGDDAKYGLYAMDRVNGNRVKRKSADLYAKIIRDRGSGVPSTPMLP